MNSSSSVARRRSSDVQGFFGKMPSHGDFVTRNLPRDFIDVWDDWLQHAVAASKASLGDNWLHTYLTSPIWRFAMVPGVCGERGWAGILMPSVDRVGRYFPLTVAASLENGTQPFGMSIRAEAWFAGAEALALTVLEQETLDADSLEASVAALDESLLGAGEERAPVIAGGEWGLRISGTHGDALPSAVSHELVHFQVGNYSLGWNTGSDESAPMALVAPELPKPDAFAFLLAGTWGDADGAEPEADEPDEADDAEDAEDAAVSDV